MEKPSQKMWNPGQFELVGSISASGEASSLVMTDGVVVWVFLTARP